MQEVPFMWDSEALAMRLDPKYGGLARARLVHGRVYVLQPVDQVSSKARGRYHALLAKIHDNLPDDARFRYPSVNALRHRLLIKCGWYEASVSSYPSAREAKGWALTMERRFKNEHPYIEQEGTALRVLWPRTQKVGDPEDGLMTKEEYHRSVEDVLAKGCELIGITLSELEKA